MCYFFDFLLRYLSQEYNNSAIKSFVLGQESVKIYNRYKRTRRLVINSYTHFDSDLFSHMTCI